MNRLRAEQELHWPDAPIEALARAERDTLLKQAGPVGEAARLAWLAYQAEARQLEPGPKEARTDGEDDEPDVMGVEIDDEEEDEAAAELAQGEAPASTEAETGVADAERARAEASAAELGLQIYDFG